MTERGMIFNGEMVRAILDGRKTQTRRVIKPQPDEDGLEKLTDGPWVDTSERVYRCPFGAVGNRIWVRETWAEAGAGAPDLKLYRANYPAHVPSRYENVPPAEEIRWTPSIHMPRWASRILLEITDVRVERLQAITLGDICKEFGCGLYDFRPATYGFQAWEELWKTIYGDDNWQANPWVWVIEFKPIEGADHATD